MSTTTLPLSFIRCDGGTQPREAINDATVAEYAERLNEGDTFPPVTVFYDGSDYWLADGFHRMAAHDEAGRGQIEADIRQGSRRDAVLHSTGANANHGMRRTNADKRRAVTVLLEDAEWGGWSDSEISRRCHVSRPFVANLRAEIIPATVAGMDRTYIHPKTGEPTQMNVGGIQKAAEERKAAPSDPPAVSDLQAFRERRGMTPLPTKRDGSIDRLAQLRAQREAQAEADRAEAEARQPAPDPKLPSPSEANRIARETGRRVIASDGHAYEGKPKEHYASEEARIERQHKLYDALQALAWLADRHSAEEIAAEIPDYQAHQIEETLGAAAEWLREFTPAWRRQHVAA
jgi:hypothetical protein